MTRIAIDAMGGDNAPFEIVAGAVWAAAEYGVAIELVGKQDRIESCLEQIENNVENENQILPKVVIENTDGWKDFEKVAINKFLENSNFGLTLDIGHSESIGNIDEEFILENKNKLFHFHIHDGTLPDEKTKSYGKNHLTLGTGKINLEERLNLAKECNGRCVIETKTVDSLRKSVEWLKVNKYL